MTITTEEDLKYIEELLDLNYAHTAATEVPKLIATVRRLRAENNQFLINDAARRLDYQLVKELASMLKLVQHRILTARGFDLSHMPSEGKDWTLIDQIDGLVARAELK